VVSLHSTADALVVSTKPLRRGPTYPPLYAAISSLSHALSFAWSDDASAFLTAVPCNTCASIATRLLSEACDIGGSAVADAVAAFPSGWRVAEVVMEVASGWPVGYRLAERCEGLADLLGLQVEGLTGEVDGVLDGALRMCLAHGCASAS